ncbi:membrane protein [Bacillus cereus]|nr:membrane protein [Bacillus cereus]
MGILGALDSGIRGNHDILFTKAIIDGFISIILTTTLGIGVVFSAIPVILYEGGIAVFATQINSVVPKELMNQFIVEMTATGGIMIAAIGLNLLSIIKIKVANLLPGILVVGVIVSIIYGYGLLHLIISYLYVYLLKVKCFAHVLYNL